MSQAPICASDPQTPAQVLLETRKVTKRFGGLQAITDVSLQLTAGQITTLVGPNGAGKTTLFNLITGQFPLTAGEVLLRGKSLVGLAPWRIARLGTTLLAPVPRPIQMRDFGCFSEHALNCGKVKLRRKAASAPDPEAAYQAMLAATPPKLPADYFERPRFYTCNRLSVVGDGCEIGPDTRLSDCTVGAGAIVEHTVGRESEIGSEARVGPYAHLPSGSTVAPGAVTGAFYTAPSEP